MLRRRTAVEHALAHIAARKGLRARYVGVQRNLFDLRRAATIQNLEASIAWPVPPNHTESPEVIMFGALGPNSAPNLEMLYVA